MSEILLQVGRVVYVTYGPLAGKLAVVLDLVNENSILIDGPTTGVERQFIPTRRIRLTEFRILAVRRNQKRSTLIENIEKFNLEERWAKTGLAKKVARQERRRNLTDFERFKVVLLRRQLGKRVKQWVKEKRKTILAGN